MKRGKNYKKIAKDLDRTATYTIEEGVKKQKSSHTLSSLVH